MRLFSRKSQEAGRVNWIDLTSNEQLDELDEQSREKPVLFFKHSTRCSISTMAKSRLNSNWDLSEDDIIPVYLDLLKYRPLSNALAERYGIMHESPQVLLIKDGRCVYNASHNAIGVREIKREL